MDINIMSAKYQKLFKEVKCFNFQKQGYWSQNFNQLQKKWYPQNYNNCFPSTVKPQFKMAQEAHTHTQSLIANLLEEEAAKVIEIAEDKSF